MTELWSSVDALDGQMMGQRIEDETRGRHFANKILKCIFLNENVWISIESCSSGSSNSCPVGLDNDFRLFDFKWLPDPEVF